MSNRATAVKNRLLAALSGPDLKRIKPFLEPISLESGQILYEPDKRIEFAYFPMTAVISHLCVMENGAMAGVSLVGNEGIIGIAPFMGSDAAHNGAIVQCAGVAFRIKISLLQKELRVGGALNALALRFALAVYEQTVQIAACNRLHLIEQQVCRWLLLTRDRIGMDTIEITHDLTSNILGVSREAVTMTVNRLKERNLIESTRGEIRIIDRSGIEANSCECYKVISRDYERLLTSGRKTRTGSAVRAAAADLENI